MMKKLTLLLGIMLVLACSSDDAVDPESLLPPITTTGENTFGCLIDGKFFRPRDGRSTINSDNRGLVTIQSENAANWEILVYDRKSTKTTSIVIHLENLFQTSMGITGIYDLGQANGFRSIDGPNNNYIYCQKWSVEKDSYQTYLSSPTSGSIVINKIQREPGLYSIHSGTFQAALINNQDSADTLFIDLGRFDLDTVTLNNKTWD
jgi:hypothetical protein